MTISVNGESHYVPESATLASLLDTLDVRRDGIAVALNDDVVPRARHADTTLRQGDSIEIIVAVAGG